MKEASQCLVNLFAEVCIEIVLQTELLAHCTQAQLLAEEMQSSLRLSGGGPGVAQHARQSSRVARLAPKAAAGRSRKLKCQAVLAGASSFMGARVQRTVAPKYVASRSQGKGRMVVKAMFERFTEKAIKVCVHADRSSSSTIAAALKQEE